MVMQVERGDVLAQLACSLSVWYLSLVKHGCKARMPLTGTVGDKACVLLHQNIHQTATAEHQ